MTIINNNKKSAGAPRIGEVYQGVVVKILDFGAFVDFGFTQDGMVHISEISFNRVENINRALSVGQRVQVKLIGFDPRGRSKLSMKQASSEGHGKGEDTGGDAQPVMGEVYSGVVTKLMDFGAFVDYGFSRDGMVHISEVDAQRVEDINDAVSVGDKVKVKFIGFDPRGRTKLSIKQVHMSNEKQAQGPQPVEGEVYSGVVAKITDFGAFVSYGFARDGMVHISEVASHRVEDIHEVLSVGDAVQVKLLEIDPRGRAKLSMKQV